MSTHRTEGFFNPGFFSHLPTVSLSSTEVIKRLVLGLDFDGCTDTQLARDKLSTDIANFVLEHPEIESLDFIVSSLRQNFYLDYYNAAIQNPTDERGRTQSCTALADGLLRDTTFKIYELFRKNNLTRTIPKVTFHPLLLSDILNDFVDGTTFSKMEEFQHYSQPPEAGMCSVTVENRKGQDISLAAYDRFTGMFEPPDENPSFDFYDTSKILLLWIQMQFFANLFGKTVPFRFRFVDDNSDIIDGVMQFFQKNRHLMPENCSFECLYMSSNDHHYPPEYKPGAVIKGAGPLHETYRSLGATITHEVFKHCAWDDEEAKTLKIKELLLTLNPCDIAVQSERDLELDCKMSEATSTERYSVTSIAQRSVQMEKLPMKLLHGAEEDEEDFDSEVAAMTLSMLSGSRW